MKTINVTPDGSLEGFLMYLWGFASTHLIPILILVAATVALILIQSIRSDVQTIHRGLR